jgi:hypothetical protein
MKKCPFCAEEIQEEAIVCRYCGRILAKRIKDKIRLITGKTTIGRIYYIVFYLFTFALSLYLLLYLLIECFKP